MDRALTLVAVPLAIALGSVVWAASAGMTGGQKTAARGASAFAATVAVGAAAHHLARLAAHPAAWLALRAGRPLALGRHALSIDLVLGLRGALLALVVVACWLVAGTTLPRAKGTTGASQTLAVGLASAGAAFGASAGGVVALSLALSLGTLGVALSSDDERLERLPLVVATDAVIIVACGYATWSVRLEPSVPASLPALFGSRAETFVRVGALAAAARLLLAVRGTPGARDAARATHADVVSVLSASGVIITLACAATARGPAALRVPSAIVALVVASVALLLAMHAAAHEGSAARHAASLSTLALALTALVLGAPASAAALAATALLAHLAPLAAPGRLAANLGGLALVGAIPALGASAARAVILAVALEGHGISKVLGALTAAAAWLSLVLVASAAWRARPVAPAASTPAASGSGSFAAGMTGACSLLVGAFALRDARVTAAFGGALVLSCLTSAAVLAGSARGARLGGTTRLSPVMDRAGGGLLATVSFLRAGVVGVDAVLIEPLAERLSAGPLLVGKAVAFMGTRAVVPPLAVRALTALALRVGIDDRASLERVTIWAAGVLAFVLVASIFTTIAAP